MDITGKVPLVLYQEIDNNENLIHGGSDIDIKISSQGKVTELHAITLGNGKWEINELDDSLNVFPEYSESDVISLDVLKKVLNQAAISSSKIFSFNLLGKVKYGLKDYGDKKAKEREEFKKKLKKKLDWFTDDIDKDTAQEFLTEKYGTTCKVGKVDKVNSIDGATFKVLFGMPKDKTFHINALHRNGNDIRLVEDEPDFPMWQSADGNEALEYYEHYGEHDSDFTAEPVNEKPEPKEGEKGFKGKVDDVEYEILEALKRKKKSKYNGCNVTGYDDGMLNMASSSLHIFSKALLSSENYLMLKISEFICSMMNTAELTNPGDYSVIRDKMKDALKKFNPAYAEEAGRIAAMWTRAKDVNEFKEIMKTPITKDIPRTGFVKKCIDNPKLMESLIRLLQNINPK